MNENPDAIQKCRACLKNSTKTFPLTKQARGCNPKRTYGQLLKEYVKLECSPDYERLMPKYLCYLCCRELRNTSAFIRQAQYCNVKLLEVIAKQLDCLQENAIDLPQNEKEGEKTVDIKREKCDNETLVKDTLNDEYNIKGLSGCSKSEVLEKSESENEVPLQHDDDNEQKDFIDNDQNIINNLLSPDCPTTSDNTTNTEQSAETEIATTCPICHKIMTRHDNLLKHMRTQHDIKTPSILLDKQKPPQKVLSCKICSSKYTNKYTYLYHVKNKHGIEENSRDIKTKDKIIKCRSCDYTARTYAALNYHTRSKHGSEKDKFKCKFCSYMCLKKFDLLTHVKNGHKELIKTLKANAEDNKLEEGDPITSSNFLNIKEEYDGVNENSGTSSDGDDDDDDNIPLAQKISKSNIKSPLNSDLDKEQFSDEEFIRQILNIKKRKPKSLSSKSLARRCEECGNIYKNYKALYAHQRHVHISEDKYSLCPHCGKKYKRKTDLKIHIEKSHIPKDPAENTKQPAKVREKRFMCTECSYVCTTITILNIHINRHHTGEKPYKCDICFKSFIVPYDLKIHRYLHTGERPYKCPICSKGFRDNSHMIKHKRIHSSERPYKCKDCGKSFTQSYNLSVHKRTHLKEKKLNCQVCGKVFENGSLLNLHRINENHHDEVM